MVFNIPSLGCAEMDAPKYAKQRDKNEGHIVEVLRAFGFVVILLDEPCDLLIQCPCGGWIPLEIKNPKGRGKRRSRKQKDTMSTLHRPFPLVTTVHGALTQMEHPSCSIPQQKLLTLRTP